jgi:CheY-like chemotaxis protein
MKQKQVHILYVDDDQEDREIFRELIHLKNPEANVVLAENGLVAIDYLQQALGSNEKLPCLIVLDINMPF